MDVDHLPSRMLIFNLNKENSKYNDLNKLIKQSDVVNKLGEFGIDISINTEVPNNMHKVDFYNYDMKLIKSYAEEGLGIKDIIDDATSMMGKSHLLEGGGKIMAPSIYYMHKYKKYKQKYLSLLAKQ